VKHTEETIWLDLMLYGEVAWDPDGNRLYPPSARMVVDYEDDWWLGIEELLADMTPEGDIDFYDEPGGMTGYQRFLRDLERGILN
jgi:hypothetical protein